MTLQYSNSHSLNAGSRVGSPWKRILRGVYKTGITVLLLSGILAAVGIFTLAIDGARDEATGTVQWRRMVAENSYASRNSTGATTRYHLGGRDLYVVSIYRAGAANVTMQDSSLWLVVDPATGASWNVTLPYFMAALGRPREAIPTEEYYFTEFIFRDNSTGGCVTVDTTSNSSRTRNGVVQIVDPATIATTADPTADDQELRLGFCSGTCSITTPLAAGKSYGFREFSLAYYNLTTNFTAYPPAHPVCRRTISNLSNKDRSSDLLRDAPGAKPVDGSALVLATDYYVLSGELQVLMAFSNATCIRLSTFQSFVFGSATLAIYSEEAIGVALRRARKNATQVPYVATNAQCSFGPNRTASIPECSSFTRTSLAVTSLDPKTRYFLMAQAYGNEYGAMFKLVKTIYSADSCKLRGVAFKETPARSSQGPITAAKQQSASEASVVIGQLNKRIPNFVT